MNGAAMSEFKRIGVFLSDCPADDAALGFAAHFASIGNASLHCIHVRSEAPSSSPGGDPEASQFETRVRKALPPQVAERATYEVHSGTGITEVLKSARDKDLDLVLMGRYLPSSQMGIGSRWTRLARKCPCSVMIIPDHCRPHFSRIQVSVDGSKHSHLAMAAALLLAKQSNDRNSQLVVQTVRHVDPRHDLAGASFQESAEAQREFGRRDLKQFLADINTEEANIETIVSLSEDPAQAIVELAMVRKMDIVVVGSRGPTRTTAAILGSTSEQVLIHCAMPVLIVKEKGETLRLLEALFSVD